MAFVTGHGSTVYSRKQKLMPADWDSDRNLVLLHENILCNFDTL